MIFVDHVPFAIMGAMRTSDERALVKIILVDWHIPTDLPQAGFSNLTLKIWMSVGMDSFTPMKELRKPEVGARPLGVPPQINKDICFLLQRQHIGTHKHDRILLNLAAFLSPRRSHWKRLFLNCEQKFWSLSKNVEKILILFLFFPNPSILS